MDFLIKELLTSMDILLSMFQYKILLNIYRFIKKSYLFSIKQLSFFKKYTIIQYFRNQFHS
jgi:hypothetical protein